MPAEETTVDETATPAEALRLIVSPASTMTARGACRSLGRPSNGPRRRRAGRLAALLRLAAALIAIALPGRAHAVPVVEPGREAEIVALFAPHALGAELASGFRLMWIKVEITRIRVIVEDASGSAASLVLEHPRRAPSGAELAGSFAVTRLEPAGAPNEGARRALDALVVALRRNDDGRFWKLEAPEGPATGGPVDGWARFFGSGLGRWAVDGIVLSILGLALVGLLLQRQLAQAPRGTAVLLGGIVALGAAIRLLVADQTAMGVWPYTRLSPIARRIYEGPVLGAIADALGTRVHLVELMFAVNFPFAVAAPVALFLHAWYVLRDHRGALAAAALIALAPNHIRFSRSEVEFIPSIALTSITFALLHASLVDPSRAHRLVATIGMPLFALLSIVTRELNILVVPLLFSGAVLLHHKDVPRRRVVVACILVALAGLAGFFGHLIVLFRTQVSEGLSLATLGNAVQAAVSLRHNTLLNPTITPPGLTLLAALGVAVLWRKRERLHVAFLGGWLVFYFACHSYVLPGTTAMQARYHLHLLPPVVLLAAPALVWVLEAHRRAGLAVTAYVLSWPLLHLGFERDTGYNDMREFAFAAGVRERIPDGCTVLEYSGATDKAHDVRFERMGAVLERGSPSARWRVLPIGSDATQGGGDPLRPEVREVLRDPPECLVFYQGIPCWSEKSPETPIAPACGAILQGHDVEPIATSRFPSRVYDEQLARGFGKGLTEVDLGLFRLRPRAH